VNISTILPCGNILFGCLRQIGCLIGVTANTGLTVKFYKVVKNYGSNFVHTLLLMWYISEHTEARYVEDFLQEIAMMKELGYHRNIVSLLGCCTLREPYCLVVEFLPHGDLLTYLRNIRQEILQVWHCVDFFLALLFTEWREV